MRKLLKGSSRGDFIEIRHIQEYLGVSSQNETFDILSTLKAKGVFKWKFYTIEIMNSTIRITRKRFFQTLCDISAIISPIIAIIEFIIIFL